MKKSLTFLLFSLFLHLSSYAQYELEWYKTGNQLYIPIGFQYINDKLICNNNFDTGYYKPTYNGHKITPIGRIHQSTQNTNYYTFSSALAINSTDGSLSNSIISENSDLVHNSFSNGDTLIMFERLFSHRPNRTYNGNIITQVDTLYMQIKNSSGGFSENKLPMTAFGNTTEKNGICDDFTIIRTNDNHHIYGILRARADSVQISGKTIVCDRKNSYVLCKFDYKGNFLWGNSICDAVQPLTLISQICSYQLDESGTGYFSGYILKNDAWILGDYFEFKGKQDPFAPEESFVIRFSANGKFLNKKFFNFYPGVSGVNARYKDRLYFLSYVNFPFNGVGLAFSGTDSNLKADIGYVIGEMDTNFNLLWHKILPQIQDVKINSVTNKYQNRIGINVQSYSSSIINDKNELILGTSRMNHIYLDKTTALYSDSTGNAYQPVLIKLSKEKGFEHLYSFGYNQPFTGDLRYSRAAGWFNISAGKTAKELFVQFTPPTSWGIGNDFYPYSQQAVLGPTIVTKLRDTTTVKDTNTTAINKLFLSKEIKIYPNPAQDVVYIVSDKPQQQALQAELYSMDGKKIFSKLLQFQQNVSLSLEGVKPGMYIIRLNNKEGQIHNKVLVKQP